MFRKFFVICFIWNIASSYAHVARHFYEAPSLKVLESQIQSFYKNESSQKEAFRKHDQKVLEIFLTHALTCKPQFIDKIKQNMSSYDVPTQKIWHQIFANLNIKGDFQIQPSVKIDDTHRIEFLLPIKTDNDYKLAAQTADKLWAAFIATGEIHYLKKIVQFLSQFSHKIRTYAFEIENRKAMARMASQPSNQGYEDLLENIDGDKTLNRHEVMACWVVLWSMESNRQQYIDIDKKVKNLIAQAPELDYRKDVKL